MAIEKQTTVVLYPSLGVGHLNPMVELAKVLLRRGVAVVIAVVDSPGAMGRLAAANPGITFRHLPVPPTTGSDHYSHPLMRTIDVLRAANPALRGFLRALPAVDALVLDMFCTDALDVAAELGVPAYFFTSVLADLAVMLHLPYIFPAAPLKDMPETALRFPGVPAIRAMDMATTVQDGGSDIAGARLRQCARMPEARGFLVNSFDWLEARALKALRCGLCTPDRPTPPVYCIGPLVLPATGGGSERHACLAWLDTQPDRSVVLLSFGSMGIFPAAQLREIARRLENSGHRFVWVVRNPPEHPCESLEPDMEALLPGGFLDRTRERGMVVMNWAPQMEVLQHDAVGTFVTRCGWNSALEGIVSGVPMRMNKVHMVEEMKVGVVVEGYEEELVKAEELEAKVRLVMESEEGKELRERLVMAREMAVDALKEGGSSDVALDEFLEGL
ncbi:hypothetical protein C2845_PM07G22430 [Panicum miliaceum]|uniref:Anthocyanidin 5,3-O-glucosyltransferase-like n=1 Tax=Panicum miliaceum TaxID=4540 RepID=A0A3L6SK17_PANMI|nr:hypothetical protein C2845_PM07G22430 [Panicum miliaceum]